MNDPRADWDRIETEGKVVIPNPHGHAVARTVSVKVPAYRDPKTGEVYFDGEAIRMLDEVKARHLGLLTTGEISALRQRPGCIQKRLSELLQIGQKSWTRWETGRERPSRWMEFVLRKLSATRRT